MDSSLGNKKVMAKNILRLMEKHGKTRHEICNALGFKYTTFSAWITAQKYPRIDKIEMMANYFGVSKAELVEEQPAATESDRLLELLREPYMMEIFDTLIKISPSNKKLILAQIEAIKKHEEAQDN